MAVKVIKMLLVESDPVLLDLLSLALKRLNSIRDLCQVITATSGPEALQLYQTEQPHLVLLDLFLPDANGLADTNGLDWMHQLKEMDPGSRTPVVVLSALGYQEIVQRALDAGAADFLVKPVNTDLLIQRVQNVLIRRGVLSDDWTKT